MGDKDAGRRVCSDCEVGHLDLASVCLGERDSAGSCHGVDEDATKGTASEGPGSLVLDKALISASAALGGAVMGGSKGLYLEEPDESRFAESRDLYLKEPEPELALITAGGELAEGDNGFGGVCANGLGPKGLPLERSAPKDGVLGSKGLPLEGCAPKDGALERDPEDATREVPTLADAALDGSGLGGPPIGDLASKTDALGGSGLDSSDLNGLPTGGLASKTDAL